MTTHVGAGRASGVVACGLALVILGAPQSRSAGDERGSTRRPDLSGTWTLDPERSQDARKLIEKARLDRAGKHRGPGDPGARRGGPPPGSRGFGSGAGGPMGRGSGPRAAELMRATRELIEQVMDAPASLTITEASPQIAIEGGETRYLYSDGRKVKADNGSGTTERRTRWTEEGLVTETRVGWVKVVETISVSADRELLFVSLRIEDKMLGDPFMVRWTFTRAEPPRSSPEP